MIWNRNRMDASGAASTTRRIRQGSTQAAVTAAFLGLCVTASPRAARAQYGLPYWINAVTSFNSTHEVNSECPVVFDSSGNMYGTSYGTADGGGTLWRIQAGEGSVSVLHTFPGGVAPSSSVSFDSSGNMYGTTQIVTTGSGYGSVWKYVPSSSTFTTIATFNGSNGTDPIAFGPGVTFDSSGNMYGTSWTGGASGDGSVWKIAPGSSTITLIASFNGTNGEEPESGITFDGSGNMYGTTFEGGSAGYGTLWKIASGSSTITSLASFNDTDGANPACNVTLDSSGNLYGTTVNGGSAGGGTLWKYSAGALSALFSFGTSSFDIGNPSGSIAFDASGNLYGSTMNPGAVWELPAGSGTPSEIALLNNGTNGSIPTGGVTLTSQGYIYGTARYGGVGGYNDGTVWHAAILSAIASFAAAVTEPTGPVAVDNSGSIYGTTAYGGSNNDGMVWKLSFGTTSIGTLASFTNTNGASPYGGVLLDSSGDLFGTTAYGGNLSLDGGDGDGTVFEIATGTHSITTLVEFGGTNGQLPETDLTLDSSGNLYGSTPFGGSDGYGNVFEVAAGTHALSAIANFGSGANMPAAALTRDSSGNLFGTTSGGAGYGTIFEIAAGTSTITTLATFNGTNGNVSRSNLVLDASGNIYGTSAQGGEDYDGTVFEIKAGTNTITVLANFASSGAGSPSGNIVLDSSGTLYGTAGAGGASNDGVVWELPAGWSSVAVIGQFSGTDGATPVDGLAMTGDGFLCGTTIYGGVNSDGTVWKF